MEMENIIKLIKTVSESNLTSFEYEEEGSRLSLQINHNEVNRDTPENISVQNNLEVKQPESSCKANNLVISSPMVGSFYTAKSEGSEPYIAVGDVIKKGQIIGIVEAMKLMNEIESEYDGVVEEILVKNKDMIEYGQPLVSLKPL
ncbi:acetyl-CoA carboxylase biotin carboxyl carrier protein [Anaerocolumna sp.]|uniref:acetyl-CoA carboxylase biotin carboxyl carrier protein n=1 Tax=Anaerocolumna sp. TaxID=2041569 RepID=UPI0028AB7290|nr:acetyl-CoA carboxylase biotin carboxyl carrier protein [Anaerocolumna sp.]